MPASTPMLRSLFRRVERRVSGVFLAESALCAGLGVSLGAIVMALARSWVGPSAVPGRAMASLALPVVVLLGWGVARLAGRDWKARFWLWCSFLLGWTLFWLAAGRVWLAPDSPGGALWLAAGLAGLSVTAGALMSVIPGIVLHRKIPTWLDQQLGLHLLLATASELGRANRPLTLVEKAVIVRAEKLAGERERFRHILIRRLSGRWWGLLGLLVAGAVLACWVAGQDRDRTAGGASVSGPPAPASAVQSSANRLYQFVLHAPAQDDARLVEMMRSTADRVSQAGSADVARQELARRQAELESEVAASAAVLAALGQLAGRTAGAPLAAVLAGPSQSAEQAIAAAQRQVQVWQGQKLSAVERDELARDLRRAAEELASTNPELADRFTRMAESLSAGRWQELLDELAAVVRQVQPIVRGHRLTESALRAMDEALAVLPPKLPATVVPPAFAPVPPAAAVSDLAEPPSDPRWFQVQRQALQELQRQSLTAEQQQLVRRYFALPD